MISSLEQLAKESSIFQSVLQGETSYPREVDQLHSYYYPRVLGKLKYLFLAPDYDKQHFNRLVTDLNELSDIFGLVGDWMAGPQGPEQIGHWKPEELTPANCWSNPDYITHSGCSTLLAMTAITPFANYRESISANPLTFLLFGVALTVLGIPAYYLVDGYAHPHYFRLSQWSSRVHSELKRHFPQITP